MKFFKKQKLNILVTGAKGQLGSYLVNELRSLSFFKSTMIGNVFGIDKDELDITNREAVANFFNKNVVKPPIDIDYVIHCAAATDTAAIEKNPYGASYDVNVLGTKNIATSCANNGIKLIFISTDYVLSEYSRNTEFGYTPHPVNAYGMQKLLAEKEVMLAYKDRPKDYSIIRSSWMFGNSEHSFVEKILTGIAKSYAKFKHNAKTTKEGPLPSYSTHNVVCDAYGRPTHVSFIRDRIVSFIYDNHFNGEICNIADCPSSKLQQISRYDWTKIIVEEFTDILYDGSPKDIDAGKEDYLEIASMILGRIHIEPCEQATFGGMRHPGHLPVDNKLKMLLDDSPDSVFKDCTRKYIIQNFKRLVKLVVDTYKAETQALEKLVDKQPVNDTSDKATDVKTV